MRKTREKGRLAVEPFAKCVTTEFVVANCQRRAIRCMFATKNNLASDVTKLAEQHERCLKKVLPIHSSHLLNVKQMICINQMQSWLKIKTEVVSMKVIFMKKEDVNMKAIFLEIESN